MYEFVLELILLAAIVLPLVAGSTEPARAVSKSRACLLRKLRRSR